MSGLLISIVAIICTIGLPILVISIIVYKSVQTKHQEKLAMIEKGMILQEPEKRTNKYTALRNGLLLVGLAVGAMIGLGISETWLRDSFAGDFMIAIMTILFGGIAFLAYFFMIRSMQKQDNNPEI
jgi:preprotein translocase subunit YajC